MSRTDDGEYTCQAFNHNNSFSEVKTNLSVQCTVQSLLTSLLPLIILFLFISLDCPFVFIANKSPYIIKVGSLAILFCSATSKPSPLVQWCKDEITCRSPQLDQSFYVVPTNVPHTTIYTCKAMNYVANVKCSRSANITVTVQ